MSRTSRRTMRMLLLLFVATDVIGNPATKSDLDTCSVDSDIDVLPLNKKNMDCEFSGAHKSEANCIGGFPESLSSEVLMLVLRKTNLGALGYQQFKNSPSFITSRSLLVLILNDTGITTLCPSIFRHTPNLRKLDLSFNKISSLFGTMFQFLADIEEINLSHNEISLIAKNTFTEMMNLKRLDLSLNQIAYFNAGLPQSLSYLNLSSNVMTELSDSLNHLGLETLDVCNNPLHNFGAALYIPKLHSVCISDDNMGDDIVRNFDAPNVKQLSLIGDSHRLGLRNGIDFSQIACDSFVKFSHMEKLSVHHYSMTHVNFLQYLRSCYYVTLQYVTVSEAIQASSFQNVMTLDLSHSRQLAQEVLTHIEIIESMVSLQKITLHHCQITSLSWFNYFSKLTNFMKCDISFNEGICSTKDETLCTELSRETISKLYGYDSLSCISTNEALQQYCPEKTTPVITTTAFIPNTYPIAISAENTHNFPETSSIYTSKPYVSATADPFHDPNSDIGIIIGIILGIVLILIIIGLVLYFSKTKRKDNYGVPMKSCQNEELKKLVKN
ncbi:leucine-rich repeat transmembrane neuronal protein 3-like isoform X2 [Artemia franciscana]|uniref:leucine-rich repeat transmembrane neuronal protein 3-like isoform X2 n=1 Tax=Artemia franciscana TaxID=6661 RepID=UPI0032DBC3DB